MESIPYHEAPVWAQQEKGRAVSLPVEGMPQRYEISAYRELCAQRRLKYQKKALSLSPLGIFGSLAHPAAFGETRGCVRAIASSHGFVVIEGEHIWDSIRAFIETNDAFHCHDNRNARAFLAR